MANAFAEDDIRTIIQMRIDVYKERLAELEKRWLISLVMPEIYQLRGAIAACGGILKNLELLPLANHQGLA